MKKLQAKKYGVLNYCGILLLLCFALPVAAQPPVKQPPAKLPTDTRNSQPPPSPSTNGYKPVEFRHFDRMSYKEQDDTTAYRSVVGNVVAFHEGTLFNCDSAFYNTRERTLQAFGNVHINDGDSINVYGQYLRYHADRRYAYLQKNVTLTDGKGVLTTNEMEYDVGLKIGIYKNGGKVVNGQSVLTSTEAYYYSDIKDAYFKKNVKLVDPQYRLKTDSLLYNLETETARFITATEIIDSSNRKINTSDGYYDMKQGVAQFGKNPTIEDGPITVTGNKIAFDEASGISQVEGNAVFVDTAQGITILANQLFSNRITGALMATKKPLLIIQQENDSLYVAADTLFSGLLSDLEARQQQLQLQHDSLSKAANLATDTSKKLPVANKLPPSKMDSLRSIYAPGSYDSSGTFPPHADIDSILVSKVKDISENLQPIQDSTPADAPKHLTDSLARTALPVQLDTITRTTPTAQLDSLSRKTIPVASDSLHYIKTTLPDSLSTTSHLSVASNNNSDTSNANRYFEAYRNVRIFSDSVQAVCDSLFYSGRDSVFRMFRNPIAWSNNTQITGDTMYMYTASKQPTRVHVFHNGLAVNRSDSNLYNQIVGYNINAYFIEGKLDYIRAKGDAESIYYVLDDDSAYVGVNKMNADAIDLRFDSLQELSKIVFINQPKGEMTPMQMSKPGEMQLRGFKWLESRRPKNKFELFE